MAIKITGPGAAAPTDAPTGAPTRLPRLPPGTPIFTEQLESARRSLQRQQLDRVLTAIEEQGRRLKERPEPDELNRYKRLVKDFLQDVVKRSFRLKVTYTMSELFHLVETVDQELLTLTELVLARQQDVLAIAAKIDRITGMLLDLRA